MSKKQNPIRIHSQIRNVLGIPLSKTANEALKDYLWLIGSQRLDLTKTELNFIAQALKLWKPQGLNPYDKASTLKTLVIDRLVLSNNQVADLDSYRLISKMRKLDLLESLKVIHLIKNTPHYPTQD